MCGICGFTGPADRAALGRMAARLRHRGPDEDGFFADGQVNLGIRRLSIVDLETGHQPLANEDGSVRIVFNGEIYNAPELRPELEARGHRFATDHSDGEVIVHLYEERGTECFHALNGMFAIALWDAARGRLLLIRDRMGVKPLFYAEIPGGLIFGSEIKALLAHPACPRAIDREALWHYFSFKCVPSPRTAFAGVSALRPSEMLSWTPGGGAARERWWRLAFREDDTCDEEAARERIRWLIDDATRLRMLSDVPIGAYLSGGVDSSAVVAAMARRSSGPVLTFTLGYEDELAHKEADLFHARRVAAAFGTEHHEHLMSRDEIVAGIDGVIRAFDQPFSGTVSTYFLSRLIAQHVKVALSGDGADELFGSYLSHRLARPLAWCAAQRAGDPGAIADGGPGELAPGDRQVYERLCGETGGEESAWRTRLLLFSEEEKRALLAPAFTDGLAGVDSGRLVAAQFAAASARGPLNRVLEAEWNTQLPDQVLAFVDFLSMAHSVEIRSPFLDYRLVEYAATLPDRLKIRGGIVKAILKEALAPVLPAEVLARPKEGFVLPVLDWLPDALHAWAAATLAPERTARHGFFVPERVEGHLAACRGRDRAAAAKVWNLMMFQLWWECFFGGSAA
ncbi:MAG TPA: asparagine synthase (glutamine-hydrolyzing) [Candidatus Methanoperedens sp.]|nr:asparagine synthase (glutamine-hydrolyzing) [Candidatus Methanoperedens sp.]